MDKNFKKLKTHYAPSNRASNVDIERQFKAFNESAIFIDLINALSQMVVVLNKERQIVYANTQFILFLDIKDQKSILGLRPGEATKCIYSDKEEGGCGTSEFCRTCGAINSILEAQNKNVRSTKECKIIITNNNAPDLRVTSTPYLFNNETFTLFAINDISNEKRRQTLEHVFFHDVLNSAGGISGLSSIMKELKDPEEIANIAQMINRSANNLIEEIQSQRQLSIAERGDLDLNITESNSLKQLEIVAELYSKMEITTGKNIVINSESDDFRFSTDMVLFRRILGNMIKNALEASLPESCVTITSKKIENKVVFSVHNNNFISRSNQLQLFKRSFSTKGVGRGIGTYSMKLFGERYLGGKVRFESSQEEGTTFYLSLNQMQ